MLHHNYGGNFMKRKCAFTLAEVLITLGIIGIVAALTMPALIADHNNRVVETRLQKFYSSMNQAIRMAELEYGDRDVWWVDNTDYNSQKAWCEKYIIPYMNVIKTGKVGDYYTIYFADGSAVSIASAFMRDWYFYPGDPEKCLKGKNSVMRELGKCSFAFYYNPSKNAAGKISSWNFDSYGTSNWDGTEASLRNHAEYGCRADNNKHSLYCTKLIHYYGWKIPDDYPYRVHYR